MNRLGIEMPQSKAVFSVEDAEKVASELGYPVVIDDLYGAIAFSANLNGDNLFRNFLFLRNVTVPFGYFDFRRGIIKFLTSPSA